MCVGLVDEVCGCGNVRLRQAQGFGFSSWKTVEPFTTEPGQPLVEQVGGGAFLLAMCGVGMASLGH